MHKKTILLELPAEIVDKIDQQNMIGDRSTYISKLLDTQFRTNISIMDAVDGITELNTQMKVTKEDLPVTGELKLTTSSGRLVGNFNINNVEGFNLMAETIARLSDDPVVRMKARKML